jgi:hypothetical protein
MEILTGYHAQLEEPLLLCYTTNACFLWCTNELVNGRRVVRRWQDRQCERTGADMADLGSCRTAQAAVFVDFDTIVLIAKLLHPALCRPIDPAVGVWLSLVEHYVRDVGVVGSNPITPTNFPGFAMD